MRRVRWARSWGVRTEVNFPALTGLRWWPTRQDDSERSRDVRPRASASAARRAARSDLCVHQRALLPREARLRRGVRVPAGRLTGFVRDHAGARVASTGAADHDGRAAADRNRAGRGRRSALPRAARTRRATARENCHYILLGSLATEKYVEPLLEIFGERLLVPVDFAGRGDMSRGGLLLRCARSRVELGYIRADRAMRHGPRPPRLPKVRP